MKTINSSLVVWCLLAAVTPSAVAEVELLSVSPAEDEAVAMAEPELLIDFSGPINPNTATLDSIKIYAIGDAVPTPGLDDVPLSLVNITAELGNTRLRISTTNPLPDGDYVWAIYGSASERSGPGYGLYFNRDLAYFDQEAFKTLGEEFTLEAWTRWDYLPSGGSNAYGAVFDVGQAGRYVPGFQFFHIGQALKFKFRLPNEFEAEILVPDILVEDEWIHLAVVSSPSGVSVYADGLLVGSMPDSFQPSSFASYIEVALTGYSRWAGAYDYVVGLFDDYRVWNVARTPEQIQATMYTPLAGHEPGLLVYHPLDQATGDVLVDVTGHGYDGARQSATRQPSEAPLIEMSPIALLGANGIAVDVTGDGSAGGVLISPFRVDTTAPRVVDLDPRFDRCTTVLTPEDLAITFDDAMDVASLIPANVLLLASGGDGTFEDGNEETILLGGFDYDDESGILTLTPEQPLTDDNYVLILSNAIRNDVGLALDGEYPGAGGSDEPLPSGDGLPGGAFVLHFVIQAGPDCNGNGTADVCELDVYDVNANGIPDDCEDCNRNNLADECDLDCSAAGGLCNVPSCGGSDDCNTNGLPDECEVRPQDWALDFDGSNDIVDMGTEVLVDPSTGFTLEAWVRTDTVSDYHRIMSKGVQGTSGYAFGQHDRRLNFSAYEVYNVTTEGAYFESGTWAHVAVAVDADANVHFFYNGQLVETVAGSGPIVPSPASFLLGSNAGGVLDRWNGVIDEVRVWDLVRTEEEIRNHMHVMLHGDEPGLLGYWLVDEGEGQSVLDRSQFGNDGVLGTNSNPGGDGADPLWVVRVPIEVVSDCNDNYVPDECDIAAGTSDDCNTNGVPDDCELAGMSASLDFDGQNDRVVVPRAEQIEPLNELTVEAWVRPDSIGSYYSRILRLSGHLGAGYTLAWRRSGDTHIGFNIDQAEFGSIQAVDTQSTDSYLGRWVHVAGVYSALDDYCRLYIDGELRADVPGVGTLRYAGADLVIGNFINSTEDFDGLIDEVRVWSVARTDSELNSYMQQTLIGNEPGLVGYWRFDEGTGQIATDSSPYDNHGRLGLDSSAGGDSDDPAWTTEGAPVGARDCNTNGVLDECDISEGSSGDCNSNGLPDECEPDWDCNTNGIQDICDLAAGTSADCNATGIPDECELDDNDCNENGMPDECEDCNSNGLADECDLAAGTSEDCNINGVPDECEPDCNTNGVADECDIAAGTSNDFDEDGVPDECQPDCNTNGFPDFLDIAFGYSEDCNLNDIPDECDLAAGTSEDCNTNGVPDECDIAEGTSGDCNLDGVPDDCEPDSDGDSIPDVCDQLGDVDHDADVDLDDYWLFETCLFLSGPGDVCPFQECRDAFDSDEDWDVDLVDYGEFQRAFSGPHP